MQLTFRTLPRDFDEPHHNADHLAAKFRNAIMPARGKLHDQRSRLIKINRVSCGWVPCKPALECNRNGSSRRSATKLTRCILLHRLGCMLITVVAVVQEVI